MAENKLKNKIRIFRFNNNEMTQESLAKAVGVSRQTISALEKNKYVPSLFLAFKIAEIFNSTVNDIFEIDE